MGEGWVQVYNGLEGRKKCRKMWGRRCPEEKSEGILVAANNKHHKCPPCTPHPPTLPPSPLRRRLGCWADIVQRLFWGWWSIPARTWPDISQGCRQREIGETAVSHERSLVENLSDYQLVFV